MINPNNDADLEMLSLENQAAAEADANAKGICEHGHYRTFPDGSAICFKCQKTFKSENDLLAEYDEFVLRYF